ncbi:MAG: HesB/IscA family protein [Chthoniobacterales bacterium]
MIQLTSQAEKELLSLLAEKNLTPENGLRLAIKQGGCAGLEYVMNIGSQQPGDVLIEHNAANVFIDASSFEQLKDCTIDYQGGLTGTGFRIINPRAVRSCGCGTSFEPESSN